ncbi:AAA family ATPase [Micromonospora sp. DT53]|uniref:AAA family ATPase n=1 Tax=Micromonospora sp. DT53 TaxID=3393444 RepID=UPI003CF265DC
MNAQIYTGSATPHDGIDRLPKAPPWRTFDGTPDACWGEDTAGLPPMPPPQQRRGATYRGITAEQIDAVNAALLLRRPLLVTGKPGVGKSSLAYAVAYELQLGPVLHWPIVSRSTVRDGLYDYDAIGRVQDAAMGAGADVADYLRLGPLGTALLPHDRPRALLIDEIDKSEIDFPNDLLTIFEEGEYTVPELARIAATRPGIEVGSADVGRKPKIQGGRVVCAAFPFILLTSNGDRDFPPAFLRRCVQLHLREPSEEQLIQIVRAHFGDDAVILDELVEAFLAAGERGEVATDQLLNAVYMVGRYGTGDSEGRKRVVDLLLQRLDPA